MSAITIENCGPVAYSMRRKWKLDEIGVTLLDEVSEGPVVTLQVEVDEISILIMGEVDQAREPLVITGAHVSSKGVNANDIGWYNLRAIAEKVMEIGNYDEIVVEGAVRTTGANTGRKPRPIRFIRSRDPAPERSSE